MAFFDEGYLLLSYTYLTCFFLFYSSSLFGLYFLKYEAQHVSILSFVTSSIMAELFLNNTFEGIASGEDSFFLVIIALPLNLGPIISYLNVEVLSLDNVFHLRKWGWNMLYTQIISLPKSINVCLFFI